MQLCRAPPGTAGRFTQFNRESFATANNESCALRQFIPKREMRSTDAAQLGEQNRLDIAFARERSCSFLARLLTAGLRNCDQILSNWHCHHTHTPQVLLCEDMRVL
jgi:hypothetical protein